MSQTGTVVLAAILLVVVSIAAVPLAVSVLPAFFAALSNADGGAVFVAVAGAFGFAFVVSVPRQR